MENLPVELIEEILSKQVLSARDVLNFSFTSSYMHNLTVRSNTIWKNKFTQNWPQFVNLMDTGFTDWYQEFKNISNLRQRTRWLLGTMSTRFYKNYELSDCHLVEWSELCNKHVHGYEYLVDDLINIVTTEISIPTMEAIPPTHPGNLTFKYYALKVLRYLRQQKLTMDWQVFLSQPPEEQLLEKGAVFVAQWCQPHVYVTWNEIAAQLDRIAEMVKMHLKSVQPNHPLFKASDEEQKQWKYRNIHQNMWDAKHCRQIINSLGVVLFKQLGFRGDNNSYYMPSNSFINEVLYLKRGLPITLAILYESIGRRLGLKCEPISFPAHFLLRMTEGNDSDPAPRDSYYIDVFNSGNIIRRGACPHSRSNVHGKEYPAATAQQVVERMANNLEVSGRNHTYPNGRITRLRSSLELLQLVSPTDIAARISLARLYMLHNMDTKPLIALLKSQEFEESENVQRIIRMLHDYEAQHRLKDEASALILEPAQRTSKLKFAVGMVMRHLNLNYRCVIYDWDPVCLASRDWQIQMQVHTLLHKEKQPFYNVLVEDGSHRYVAQENLEPYDQGGLLDMNDDLGRHFSHFYRTHYVPNREKEMEYPEDKEVRLKFHLMITGDEA